MAVGFSVRLESVVTLTLALVLQLNYASSLPEDANCTVGGLLPNIPCAAGLQCVIYDEGNIPLDQPALGNCRRVDNDTCFDKARGIYFAPGGSLAYSDCGPCKCPAMGGKFKCEKCILAGGTCTVGGFFRQRPLECAKGLQCVLYLEGNIRADGPGVGICRRPTRNTCYDKERGLLFFPRTHITNKCGPCRCPRRGGKILCRVPVAECLVDPCTVAKCPKHPSAECQADYCGGCNFEFFLNNAPVDC